MEFDLRRRSKMHDKQAGVESSLSTTTARPSLPIQRRMNVGSSDDPHEREADRVADDVVRRLAAPDGLSPVDGVQTGATSRIRRRESGAAGGDGFVAPNDVERDIRRARSGGHALDGRTRARFEGAMGADLSGVRIHRDAQADQLNRQVSAKAFTTGTDVFFSSGTFDPNSSAGQHLLAHELAHTVQQGGSVQRRNADPDTIHRKLAVADTKWGDATSIGASGGSSLTGVFFLKDKSGGGIVVKGALGAARNALAGEIMDMATGSSVDQRVILLASPEGQRMLKVLHKLAAKDGKKKKLKKDANPIEAKITSQLDSGKFDSVVVMATQVNLSDFEALTAKADFGTMIQKMADNGFFAGLGKIHAADMMMGNEDRLQHMNVKNIFFDTASGEAVGLDLDLNAHSFDQVTKKIQGAGNEAGGNRPSLAGHEFKDFVAYSIDGSASSKTVVTPKKGRHESPMTTRGGKMSVSDLSNAADPAKAALAFEGLKKVLIDEAAFRANGAVAVLAGLDWATLRAQFLVGVEIGMKKLTAKMGDIAKRAGELSNEHGADTFLDPNTFRVRGMYYQLLQLGMPDNEVRELLETYAEHILKGGSDESFLQFVKLCREQAGQGEGLVAIRSQPPNRPLPPTPDDAAPKGPLRRPRLALPTGVKPKPGVFAKLGK